MLLVSKLLANLYVWKIQARFSHKMNILPNSIMSNGMEPETTMSSHIVNFLENFLVGWRSETSNICFITTFQPLETVFLRDSRLNSVVKMPMFNQHSHLVKII